MDIGKWKQTSSSHLVNNALASLSSTILCKCSVSAVTDYFPGMFMSISRNIILKRVINKIYLSCPSQLTGWKKEFNDWKRVLRALNLLFITLENNKKNPNNQMI